MPRKRPRAAGPALCAGCGTLYEAWQYDLGGGRTSPYCVRCREARAPEDPRERERRLALVREADARRKRRNALMRRRQWGRQNYQKNRQAILAYNRAWDKAHPESAKARRARWYWRHREQRLAYQAAWRQAYRDYIAVYNHRYHRDHRDEIIARKKAAGKQGEYKKRYRDRHRDVVNERRRAYWADNKEKLNAQQREWRAARLADEEKRAKQNERQRLWWAAVKDEQNAKKRARRAAKRAAMQEVQWPRHPSRS